MMSTTDAQTGAAVAPTTASAEPQSQVSPLICEKCNEQITSQYVRALGSLYHVNCFRCMDCNEIVTTKFFSFTLPNSKQAPLCEVHYFGHLDLLCAKCGQALRGNYITASDKKYHVQHFTCSCCDTLFGPQDSYYEHTNAEGTDVYCHFHYSTRCAQKCASCQIAILRQFVEVNRSSRDEAYHLPCHLIQKFWNVKIGGAPPPAAEGKPRWEDEEVKYTPDTIREVQKQMDELVHRIWTVLSAFEESSAACISDLLKSVSNAVYLEAIRSAERFTLHIEVLFAALDELEFQFEVQGVVRGISHVRESRMLCRKTVDLFTQLSLSQKDVSRQGITQDLLNLISGIAHYLKILLRISLLAALRLRRDHDNPSAINTFLDQLQGLMEQNGDPLASRQITNRSPLSPEGRENSSPFRATFDGQRLKHVRSRSGVAFGFKSLTPEVTGTSPYAQEYYDVQDGTNLAAAFVPPSDLCVKCKSTIENDCVRLGTFKRWHLHCLCCDVCGKAAVLPPTPKTENKSAKSTTNDPEKEYDSHEDNDAKREAQARLQDKMTAELNAEGYAFDTAETTSDASVLPPLIPGSTDLPTKIYCMEHRVGTAHLGFQTVSRLEQYSYLLNVALLRLYSILKRRGAIQPPTGPLRRRISSPRESMDLVRLRSVSLDRKSTSVKTPKRSTIVESPIGKVAHTTEISSEGGSRFTASPKKSGKPSTPPSPGRTKLSSPPQKTPSKVPLTSTYENGSKDGISSTPPPNGAFQIRPEFTRMNSQVVVMDEIPNQAEPIIPELNGPIYEEPMEEDDRESLTLADISNLVEVDQASNRRASFRIATPGADTPLLSDLDTLDLTIVKHAALWMLNNSVLKDKFDFDEMLEGIEVRKGSLWKQFFRGEKKVKKKGVYGVPLELLTERDGVESTLGVSRNPVRIPIFLDDVITAMRQMDVSVEGIFRRNGNIKRMRETIEALDRDPESADFSQENPIQLAALLKKFFIDLPDPLLTHRLHGLLIATQSITDDEERGRLLHLVSILLPKSHRNTMEVLFVFLKWVALFSNMDSGSNKMDIPNLSTVIAPSILCAKGYDPLKDQSFAAIAVVTEMVERQDVFNLVPEHFLQLLSERKDFAKYTTESSKEIMKKIDQFYRGKKNGQGAKSLPVMSPTTAQFAPSSYNPSLKSEATADTRGRPQSEKKSNRESKSLERNQNRDRANTLRKPKPGLPHSPFSLPSGFSTNGGSTPKLTAEGSTSTFSTLGALSPSIRSDIQPPMKSPHVPSTMEQPHEAGNGQ